MTTNHWLAGVHSTGVFISDDDDGGARGVCCHHDGPPRALALVMRDLMTMTM